MALTSCGVVASMPQILTGSFRSAPNLCLLCRSISSSSSLCRTFRVPESFFYTPRTLTSRESNAVLKFWKGPFDINYPADGKYTVKPLKMNPNGGRDPISGRVLVHGWGGGCVREFYWVEHKRVGPTEGPPLEEKVLKIQPGSRLRVVRTADIALVGRENHLRWITATVNMKEGDIIQTCMQIPRNPVSANEGDAWPVGAFPVGTTICCIEFKPGSGAFWCRAAGASAKIARRVNDNVVIHLPSKHEFTVDKMCMAVSGQVSNTEWDDWDGHSLYMNFYRGIRPDSGEHHGKKTGFAGRKNKRPIRADLTGTLRDKPTFMKLTYRGDTQCDPEPMMHRERVKNVHMLKSADFKGRWNTRQDAELEKPANWRSRPVNKQVREKDLARVEENRVRLQQREQEINQYLV